MSAGGEEEAIFWYNTNRGMNFDCWSPNNYEQKIITLLTKPTTTMWIFFRPTPPRKKEEKVVGFKVIKGEFLVSFR
jgi:hypothetical protein